MRQIALRFGRQEEMIGILALPLVAEMGTFPRRALLVWNTGISHRVGPNRINTELAKSLTSLGLAVFRFDLSGRGDSQSKSGDHNSAIDDVREAMSYLSEAYGFREFILHGLCSGAVEAHYVATVDERVVGLSMVDTYAHRVGKYYLYYILNRLSSGRAWLRLLERGAVWRQRQVPVARDQFFVPFPTIDRIRSDFAKLIERKVKCFIVYTNGYDYIYNYKNQFHDMLGGMDMRGMLTLHHHDQADHLYTLVDQREKLMDAIAEWTLVNFG